MYNPNDYDWVRELLGYPQMLDSWLGPMVSTESVQLPEDPIDRVIFQEKAKKAIRKIAYQRGHVLMVGKPGTGKSMLANMLQDLLGATYGEDLRFKEAVLAYPGKDKNHIRIAYEDPEQADATISSLRQEIEEASRAAGSFSLEEAIQSAKRVKRYLIWATVGLVAGGAFRAAAGCGGHHGYWIDISVHPGKQPSRPRKNTAESVLRPRRQPKTLDRYDSGGLV